MVGCGETYLPAFALALGLGPVAAGLMASVPLLAGALVQLVTPLAVARIGSNRRWVIACTSVQAASFLPLVWWALRGHAGLAELLGAAALYWAAGMAGVPAWNAWMADLVPDRLRTPYFARRSRLGQFAVCAGFLAGGGLLQFGEQRGAALAAFAVLFVVAALFRLLGTACLWACSEPARPAACDTPEAGPLPSRVVAALARMRTRPSGALVAFLCAFMFAAQFAGPYFIPYMRDERGFSYAAFTLVIATGVLSKALFLPALGRLASRVGSVRLLWLASMAIAPLTLLWIPSAHVGWLCVVQVFAGGCWAGYELAVTLLLFEALSDRERTGVVTVYNLGIAAATVAGAAAGGLLLRTLGETPSAYAAVFTVSCLLRLAALPLLRRVRLPG